MSEPNASGSQKDDDDDAGHKAGDELQFDQAEYATPTHAGSSCGVCKRPIDDVYYEFNSKICCATCRQQIEAAFRGGSRAGRVIKALVFGSLAALAGAILYYAIIRITGYNIGLVAIVVGVMVGGAVRKGTGNRGGLFYQFLALLLAYMAIGLMHVPMLIEEQIKTWRAQAEQAKILPEKNDRDRAKVDGEPKAPATRELAKHDGEPKAPVPKDRAKVEGENQHAVDAEEKPDVKGPQLNLVVGILFLFVLAIAVVFSLPVVAAIADPISALIYCIALWTAWGANKPAKLAFNGPFRVSTGDSNAPPSEDVDDDG